MLHPLTRERIGAIESAIIDGDYGGTSSDFNAVSGENGSMTTELNDFTSPQGVYKNSTGVIEPVQKKQLPIVKPKNINWNATQKTVLATGTKVQAKSPGKVLQRTEESKNISKNK